MRIRALSYCALILLAVSLGLALNSGSAQASDDWSTGHTYDNGLCFYNYRWPSSAVHDGSISTEICWNNYSVAVRGHAMDGSGYCTLDEIRYKVFTTTWSDWQTRRIATACGSTKESTWWWSLHPIGSVQTRACRIDGAGGPIVDCDPDWH
jgi:hypothetical protein